MAADTKRIRAYLSHSYRPKDRKITMQVLRLLHKHNLQFKVDPPGRRDEQRPMDVTFLERMMWASACFVAVGIGARVSILDINPSRLGYVHDVMQGHVSTLMSNPANIEEEVASADLVIGAVLIPGARAPKLVTREMLRTMRRGSALVDIAVDQGGCCETTRPTTHRNPTYIEEGVVHYCVANMPGAVPRTSTYALTNATLQYGLELANKGWKRAIEEDPILQKGVNIADGKVTHKEVADAFEMDCTSL